MCRLQLFVRLRSDPLWPAVGTGLVRESASSSIRAIALLQACGSRCVSSLRGIQGPVLINVKAAARAVRMQSKRLQGGDLFALRRHQPAERHIEQKCRDAQRR